MRSPERILGYLKEAAYLRALQVLTRVLGETIGNRRARGPHLLTFLRISEKVVDTALSDEVGKVSLGTLLQLLIEFDKGREGLNVLVENWVKRSKQQQQEILDMDVLGKRVLCQILYNLSLSDRNYKQIAEHEGAIKTLVLMQAPRQQLGRDAKIQSWTEGERCVHGTWDHSMHAYALLSRPARHAPATDRRHTYSRHWKCICRHR